MQQRIIEYKTADLFQLQFLFWMQGKWMQEVSAPILSASSPEEIDQVFAYMMRSHSWWVTPYGETIRIPCISHVTNCIENTEYYSPAWVEVMIVGQETFDWWKAKEVEWQTLKGN